MKNQETKNIETNEDGNTTYCSKNSSSGKLMGINIYIKKERSRINNLTLQLSELEREQSKPNISRGKTLITKIKGEINKKPENNRKSQ